MHEQLRDHADGYHFKECAKCCETRRVERSPHIAQFDTELLQNCGRHVSAQVVENTYWVETHVFYSVRGNLSP